MIKPFKNLKEFLITFTIINVGQFSKVDFDYNIVNFSIKTLL